MSLNVNKIICRTFLKMTQINHNITYISFWKQIVLMVIFDYTVAIKVGLFYPNMFIDKPHNNLKEYWEEIYHKKAYCSLILHE